MTSARRKLKRKGYTLVMAAKTLGVTDVHLMRVLNGERPSRRLSAAAEKLPNLEPKNSTRPN